jgi:hypothetical protein
MSALKSELWVKLSLKGGYLVSVASVKRFDRMRKLFNCGGLHSKSVLPFFVSAAHPNRHKTASSVCGKPLCGLCLTFYFLPNLIRRDKAGEQTPLRMSLRAASANLRFGGVLNQTLRINQNSNLILFIIILLHSLTPLSPIITQIICLFYKKELRTEQII